MSVARWYQQLKNVYHFLQAHAWRVVYRWPDRRLKLYGVTGTNGKTTTSIVLATILREAYGRERVGLLSTEVFWFGEREEANVTHMTALDARIVFRYLWQMADRGVTHVVLEMTSHALDQGRLAGITLGGAIMLNIQQEHLDYHRTMAEYARAKARIVRYLAPDALLVANGDDKWVRKALAELRHRPRAGPRPRREIMNYPAATGPRFGGGESRITWFTRQQAREMRTPLPGDFNKENVLAASLLAEDVGVDRAVIEKGVALVTGVPGRVEWLDGPQGSRVVIDFALTPYAYDRLFRYLREETAGRLIGVFGAAGRRDKDKRPKITKAVAQYADEIVLTQDEPYDDPEEEIYAQLETGLAGANIPWQRIEDRTEAIRYALQRATSGDVVAVVGMGNFDTRVVGDKKIPWNDRQVIIDLRDQLSGKRDQ